MMTMQTMLYSNGTNKSSLAKVMYMLLVKFGMPLKFRMGSKATRKHEQFIDDFFTACEDYTLRTGQRLRMPLDLGYMQLLKHESNQRRLSHLNDFGLEDYSLVWVIHKMFQHVVMVQTKRLKAKVLKEMKAFRRRNVITNTPSGDYYFLLNNKHIMENFGFSNFEDEPKHYTKRLIKRVV